MQPTLKHYLHLMCPMGMAISLCFVWLRFVRELGSLTPGMKNAIQPRDARRAKCNKEALMGCCMCPGQ